MIEELSGEREELGGKRGIVINERTQVLRTGSISMSLFRETLGGGREKNPLFFCDKEQLQCDRE